MRYTLLFLITFFSLVACKEEVKKTDEILLQLNLKEGDQFASKMTIEQSMEADVNGLFSLIDQTLEFNWTSEVIKDSSKYYTIQHQYQKVYLSQNQSDDEKEEAMVIDTDELKTMLPTSELEKYYDQLTKFSFLTVMNQEGQEISSTLDSLNKKIGGEQFTSPFQSMFQYGVYFPDYVLKEKDVWYKEISIKNAQIVVTGNIRYQLETWDDEVVYIQMRSQLKGRHVGFDVGGQIDVEKNGLITVYRQSGWIKEANLEQIVKWLDINSNENRLLGQIHIVSEKQ